ncbi:MAG: hypothetical protein EOO67_20605, partial [Microbacterium sp.]
MTASGTLRAGWRDLAGSPDRILVPTLVLSTVGIVAHVLLQYLVGVVVAGSSDCARPYLDGVLTARCGPTDARAQLTLLIGLFLLYLVGQVVVAGLYRAALDLVDAAPVRSPFAGWLSLRVVGAAAVFAVLMTINTVFLLLPALVLGFLIRYAPLYVVDQGLGPVAAVVASTRFVLADLGGELWFVVRAVLALLG